MAATKAELEQLKQVIEEALMQLRTATEARMNTVETGSREVITMANRTLETMGKLLTDSSSANQTVHTHLQEQLKIANEKMEKLEKKLEGDWSPMKDKKQAQ